MKNIIIVATISLSLTLISCSDDKSATTKVTPEKLTQTTDENQDKNNVLLSVSALQDQAPHFDKINITDFIPAFTAGIEQEKNEIDAIANNIDVATFDNTIVAMEKTGATLDRVQRVFNSLSSLISNQEFQDIESEMTPKLTAHDDDTKLNATLFARIEAVYNNKESHNKEDQRLIEYYYNDYVRSGAKLSEQVKNQMREINGELAKLATNFSQNILKSFKDDVIMVTNKEHLIGLSEHDISSLSAAAKAVGKEGYMITLVNTTRQPILGSLQNRELRQKIWETSANRAKTINGPIIIRMAELRANKSKLLGYPSWAAYITANNMAKTPEAVLGMLDGLVPKAVAKAKTEAVDIQAMIAKEGNLFTLEPWDWAIYADQVRMAKYDLDEAEVKPYFEFNTVLNDGLYFAMNKLYGITLKSRTDLPVWHKDVLAYEVFNEDGSSVGLFYLDPYAREGKAGGAWMDELVTQSGLLGNKPVIYNSLNIPKPAAGQPTLMTFDEVGTLFHEFGHAVHGLFSQVKYPSLAGTNTARDFVEFPSQFNEDWNINPEVIANYAKHYETGNPIPAELLAKVLKAHKFNQGFNSTESLAAALLDMEWHTLSAGEKITDFDAFETKALTNHGINYAPVSPRYKSAYFSHIFSSPTGYSSGYYAYYWTEVIAADAFAHMTANGGLTRENGDSYRKEIISKGNSQDLMQNYINFRGQKPTVDALLKRRGLTE